MATLEDLGTNIRLAKGSWDNFRDAVKALKDSPYFASLNLNAKRAVDDILSLNTEGLSERATYNWISDYRNMIVNAGIPFDRLNAAALAPMPYWESGQPRPATGGRRKTRAKKSRKQRRKTLRRKR